MTIDRQPLWGAIFLLLVACGGSEAVGRVQIIVVPEETITAGLEPGSDPENIRDGWTIAYDRYLVAVGNFGATRTDSGDTLSDPTTYVLDMKHAPSSGYVAKEFTDVAAVRWDKFGYDIPNAKEGVDRLPPATEDDLTFMTANGYSVYFEGTAAKDADRIAFAWGFAAGTAFGDCSTEDGIPGFAVPSSGTVQVKPTIHGDHQYFSNVTQGVELTERLAQWIKTCDGDSSSELTMAELAQCDAAVALPTPPYDLTAVRDQDEDGKISVFDYVDTQMRTLGDFQGDGECPARTRLP